MGNEREKICIDGIIIPPGHKPLLELGEVEPEALAAIEANIRTFNDKVSFILEPGHPEYLAMLDRCRCDTRALARHLHAEITKRDLPVYAGGSKRKNPKEKQLMSFLIRPPFLTSDEEKSGKTRMQPIERKHVFILHFDEERTLHTVRSFLAEDDRRLAFRWQMISNLRHPQIVQTLKEAYGQWDEFVIPIADAIERNHKVLRGDK